MDGAKFGLWMLAAAGLFAGAARARALDASDVLIYEIGPVHVKPRVSFSEQYDDNILRGPSPGAMEDFITIISPGVGLQLGRIEANHIFFDYVMDQSLYASHGTQDHRDHILSLNTKIKRARVTLEGQTGVQFLSGVIGGSFNLPGQRVDRVSYGDDYRLDYAISEKTGTYVAGGFAATDYKEGISLYDENDLRATGGFAYKVTPRTSLFGELYYGQTATSPNTSSLSNAPYSFIYGGFVGVNGDFTTQLKGSVKLGYEAREFGGNTPGSKSPVVEVTLKDKFSEWTDVSLTYSRRSEVSVQVASQAYTSDSVSARLNQVLTPDGKLVANVGGDLVNSEYENRGFYARRSDRNWRASVALVYRFQVWLSAQLGYEFEKFTSNQYFEYDDNRFTVRVSVGY